jgi:hypothetical protein
MANLLQPNISTTTPTTTTSTTKDKKKAEKKKKRKKKEEKNRYKKKEQKRGAFVYIGQLICSHSVRYRFRIVSVIFHSHSREVGLPP